MRCWLLFFVLFLGCVAAAQTVRIQGKEVPYQLIDGRQMISREVLAQNFPGFESGEGMVDLSVLIDDPNARVMRRNGLIVSVRYYNSAMAAIYGPSRSKPRTGPDNPSAEPGPEGNTSYRALMDEVVRLSNIEREKHGVGPLTADRYLEAAATGHSEEMARLGYFSHTSPTPGRETPHERIMLAGASPRSSGENIAAFDAYAESTLAREAVTGWMNSPGHRRNLLDPGYTHIGIGVARIGNKYYLTQNFCAY